MLNETSLTLRRRRVMMNKMIAVRRWSVLILCFAMVITCIPMLEGAVYAADDKTEVKVVELSEEEQQKNKEKAVAKIEAELGIQDEVDDEEDAKEATAVEDAGEAVTAEKAAPKGPLFNASKPSGLKLNNDSLQGLKLEDTYDKETGSYVSASDPDEQGLITLTGNSLSGTGFKYKGIFISDDVDDVDNAQLMHEFEDDEIYGFTGTIDMKKYTVGYHTLFILYSDEAESQFGVFTLNYIPTYIYAKPSNSINYYYTYITKFDFKNDSGSYYYDKGPGEYLDTYMDYRKGTKGSYSKYVYQADYSWHKITGLKANTTYQARMMYGKSFEYDGKELVITGRQAGYASSPKKFMTAYKKPKVKKIDITKVKQYCHKYRVQYAWRIWYNKRTGVIVRRKALYHTYRYWYTRFTIKVKFKKKQNVAGIRIDTIHNLGTWKGGNKKTYSQKFVSTGKKKGKKITVKVKSCRSKKYGGWSKVYKKKVRCR